MSKPKTITAPDDWSIQDCEFNATERWLEGERGDITYITPEEEFITKLTLTDSGLLVSARSIYGD